MKSNHTPGPWKIVKTISDEGIARTYFLVLEKKSLNAKNIAKVIPCFGMEESEIKDNALLIQAAPKMYSVLKEINEYLSGNPRNYVGSGSLLHEKIVQALCATE